MVIVVMGVAGAGKTTVGKALAARLGARFVEGDVLHPASNVAKMSRGEALDDGDRGAWLARVRAEIESALSGGGEAVVACSALKRRYREVLGRAGEGVVFVHLRVGRDAARERLSRRSSAGSHFMPVSLLESQFEALEAPGEGEEGAIVVDAERAVGAILEEIAARLGVEKGRGGEA